MTEFIKSATKKSLLAIVKEPLTPRSWARLFEALVTKDELQDYVVSSVGDSTSDTKKLLEGYVKRNGTTELTADWDAGSYEITAETLESDVTTGTAPLTVASTTLVDNLNADTVDGSEEAVFAYVDGTRAFTGDVEIESAADPTLTLAEGGSATYYSKIYDVDVDLHIDKVTAAGPTVIYIDPKSGSPGGDNFVSLFRNTDTALYGGNSVFRIYYGDGTDTIRHYWVASNGYAHVCRNAGTLTVAGASAGTSRLSVNGSFAPGLTTTSGASGTLDVDHHTRLLDASSNAVTITLPAAATCVNRIYNIKCIDDTYACQIATDGSEEIDGDATNFALVNMEVISIQSDGSNWWII